MNKDLLKPVSGFLEYTPSIERARRQTLARITALYESFGYLAVNTPEVERLEILTNKGDDVNKEIYTVDRIWKDPEQESDSRLGLRFDLTVPLARYVARFQNELTFPFKRYQAQSCFRGERPQEGRFRQFLQCDVDIIGSATLPIDADLEVAEIGLRAIEAMGVTNFTFRISNRKLLRGIMQALEAPEPLRASRVLDKLAKIGEASARAMLKEIPGMTEAQISCLLEIGKEKCATPKALRDLVLTRVDSNELIETGLSEAEVLLTGLQRIGIKTGEVVVDLAIIRGLDYYTGSVFEVTWEDYRNIGSIAAGGRYDNLTGLYTKAPFPGVGFSLGFSRIFDKLITSNTLTPTDASPAQVYVARLLNDTHPHRRLARSGLRSPTTERRGPQSQGDCRHPPSPKYIS
jgi:histidyl-tRNA synthetase